MRTGMKAFFMAVKSDAAQSMKPALACGDSLYEFFWLVLGKSPEEIVRLFELLSVSGINGAFPAAPPSSYSHCAQVSHPARRLLQSFAASAVALSMAASVRSHPRTFYR